MNLSHAKPGKQLGFTLIELLFVIAIIAVLATMALGVMKGAQDDAKAAATRARISQIEAILQVQLEDYEVRKLPIRLSVLSAYVRANPIYGDSSNPRNVGAQVRNLRRRILADMINAEFPRPVIGSSGGAFQPNPDLGIFPTTIPGAGTGSIGFWEWLDDNYPNSPGSFPDLRDALRSLTPAKVKGWGRFNGLADFNLPGEYLYALLARIDLDGSPAIETLGNNAIGDFDEDGLLEVIDAWGDPMQLRIWQIDAQEVDSKGLPEPGTDVWEDKPDVNFDIRLGAREYEDNFGKIQKEPGTPTGYTVLNPTIPREVNKIRFEVTSTRLIQ